MPNYLVDGIQLFIDTFIEGRINLRLYPFPTVPSFQLMANLKKDCLVDGDMGNVSFAYGNRPNIPMVVLGLVTSIPPHGEHPFDPMQEYEHDTDLLEGEGEFEVAFRTVFSSLEAFGKFAMSPRYPMVAIYPLAVYRALRPMN